MSESFEKLQNRILADARVKAGDIIREAEEKASQVVETARTQAQREADVMLAKVRLDADALRRSILSSKVRANRLRVLGERNRMVESVLSSVREKLSTLGEAGGFMDTVKRMVNEAVEAIGTDQSVVRVGFNQISSKDLGSIGPGLSKGAKLVVEDKAIDELGGVVARDSQGRVVYNNSFRARMDRLDSQLLALISSTVFGE